MSSRYESGIVSKTGIDVKKEWRFGGGFRVHAGRVASKESSNVRLGSDQPLLNALPTLNSRATCITENTIRAIVAARIGMNRIRARIGATKRPNSGPGNEQTNTVPMQDGIPMRTVMACFARSSRRAYLGRFSQKQFEANNVTNACQQPQHCKYKLRSGLRRLERRWLKSSSASVGTGDCLRDSQNDLK